MFCADVVSGNPYSVGSGIATSTFGLAATQSAGVAHDQIMESQVGALGNAFVGWATKPAAQLPVGAVATTAAALVMFPRTAPSPPNSTSPLCNRTPSQLCHNKY